MSGTVSGRGQSSDRRPFGPFFGVRGVGSLYYLAYAAGEASELGSDWLWATVAFTVVASVLVHGVLATPVMRRLDPDGATGAA